MTGERTAITIEVQPWFADHCFDGKVVLPAVETMLLLAEAVAATHPEIDIRVMAHVRFSRFLEIAAGSGTVAALIECGSNEDGSVLVKLLSRRQFKAMTRLQEHGEILFLPDRGRQLPAMMEPEPPATDERRIPAEQIYRELVPFGPAYRTLQGDLRLAGRFAWGRLRAPVPGASGRGQALLGSPFPLDGAFHAACVLGQRSADFVPFPVGFDRRIVVRPTQPGASYRTRVQLLSQTRDELLFDLQIVDEQGELFEGVSGLRMRDVSGGRIKPPEWIKKQE